ncbi:uncharacterized protein V1510DRAFT_415979 [Dipodascopsis tothii]|uniref:uncharacterized protein n=1 Tax=Dipodascopsis tothii TaxID=44089 RepID=UPI0034CD7EB1
MISYKLQLHSDQRYYVPGEPIAGKLTFQPAETFKIAGLSFELVGETSMWSNKSTYGRVSSKQQFLRMHHVATADDLPADGVAYAGTPYSVPFSFTLPQTLLESACSSVPSHRLLPPSLDGRRTVDDCTPDMARVTYTLRWRLSKKKDPRRSDALQHIADALLLHVVASHRPTDDGPTLGPALTAAGRLRTERALRKGVLRQRVGTLMLEMAPPAPFVYRSAKPTMYSLNLSYAPAGKARESPEVPKIKTIAVRLKAYTYFSPNALTYVPTAKSHMLDGALGVYTQSYHLAALAVGDSAWTHDNPDYYTLATTVPVMLPEGTALAPDFQSCLVCRQYELDVTVKFATGSDISLTVPVHIQVDGRRAAAAAAATPAAVGDAWDDLPRYQAEAAGSVFDPATFGATAAPLQADLADYAELLADSRSPRSPSTPRWSPNSSPSSHNSVAHLAQSSGRFSRGSHGAQAQAQAPAYSATV